MTPMIATTPTPPTPQMSPQPNTDFRLGASEANGTASNSAGGSAQGDSGMSQAQQGLLSSQLGKASGDNTSSLMEGVGSASQGLLKDTPQGSDEGFNAALSQANQDAVGQQSQRIQSYLSATAPLRQATYEQEAAGNLAKVSQLDMNDFMLYNQQQLQQLQLSQAQAAAQMQFTGQVVGAIGGLVGTVAKAG